MSLTDDTKARLAELAARAAAASSALVRPTDAELGQARAWVERTAHRWNPNARLSQEDAKTIARVLAWLLAERVVLRRVAYQATFEAHGSFICELKAALRELAEFDAGKELR